MRLRSAFVLCGVLLVVAISAFADSTDDQYVRIYNLIQQADALAEGRQLATATAKYTEAQTALERFQGAHPDWNPVVVKFRLNYIGSKLAELSPKPVAPAVVETAPPTTAMAAVIATAPPALPAKTVVEPPPLPPDKSEEIKSLQEQIRQLTGDKASLESARALLEAKLKEALGARPASVDPVELTKAQEEIRALMKENDLLKVSLEQSKAKKPQVDPVVLEDLRRQVADAKNETANLAAANALLVADNVALRAKNAVKLAPSPETIAMRQENEVLRKQVRELSGKSGNKSGDVEKQLAAAQAQLAAMQSDRDMLQLERTALEGRVKQMTAAVDPTNATKIKELEAQRDGLQRKLDVATAELASRKSTDKPARVEELSSQIAVLKVRIEVLESKPLPYTAEELALISKPEGPAMLVASFRSPPRKSAGELPANGASLVAEAKRHYAAGELDKAEASYKEVIKLESTNVAALADLAMIQSDMNHVEDAEKSIQSALAVDPNHEYSTYVLGRIKFREEKYDDALEAFSKAAAANPQSAEIQNYIGITLSEKGLRVPAEAALRKAVDIDPKYGSAHANLAFIYATEQPPRSALARWHYEKAISLGNPRNPGLEKRLGITSMSSGGDH